MESMESRSCCAVEGLDMVHTGACCWRAASRVLHKVAGDEAQVRERGGVLRPALQDGIHCLHDICLSMFAS